uniref:Secreted protein n=1 Tax=Caenorhabditis tropicalis TaxID=1561998 RepID=A0A1I7TSV5_9PELO
MTSFRIFLKWKPTKSNCVRIVMVLWRMSSARHPGNQVTVSLRPAACLYSLSTCRGQRTTAWIRHRSHAPASHDLFEFRSQLRPSTEDYKYSPPRFILVLVLGLETNARSILVCKL